MKLLWVQYLGSKPKYRLLLELGEYAGKISCLIPDQLSDDEIAYIRRNLNSLETMSLKERVAFIREYNTINNKFNRVYRTIPQSNLKIDRSFDIREL